MNSTKRIMEILRDAKKLAQEYRNLTGKPLGVTGEVAEYEAARILNLELTPARHAGYDATEVVKGHTRRLQIKSRCILEDSKRSQMTGSIDIDKEFDAVLLVLLDHCFEAVEIYEAERRVVVDRLEAPGSKARMNVTRWRSASSNLSVDCDGSGRLLDQTSPSRTQLL